MKTLLVLNVLYYAKAGMTQRDICQKTFSIKADSKSDYKNLFEGWVRYHL